MGDPVLIVEYTGARMVARTETGQELTEDQIADADRVAEILIGPKPLACHREGQALVYTRRAKT